MLGVHTHMISATYNHCQFCCSAFVWCFLQAWPSLMSYAQHTVCHRGYAAPPPARPPASIVDALTVGGQVPLEYLYVDDTNGGKGQR